MPHKDPDIRRAYDRERKRRARAGAQEAMGAAQKPSAVVLELTPDILLSILGGQLEAVQGADVDVVVRARTVARLSDSALKVLEVGDLAEQDEAVFAPRVVGIVHQSSPLISEHRCRFIEGNAMLAPVLPFLAVVP